MLGMMDFGGTIMSCAANQGLAGETREGQRPSAAAVVLHIPLLFRK